MQAQAPHIIGISGGSCAGKTWLADRLLEKLGKEAARISQDDFYLDRSHLSAGRRARLNFDHPRAIDWESLREVLESMAEGRPAAVPRYDFATHGRLAGEIQLAPRRVILVEGLWIFRQPEIRKLFHLKVFIRTSQTLCIERRLKRDTAERGRTRTQVLEQLERYTLPMSERFVAPQEKWADVVLEAPIQEEQITDLLQTIQETRRRGVGI